MEKKGISVVIPISDKSKNHKELIYAIRSLEKNLKGIGDIFVVGTIIKPLKGLKYIQCKDEPTSKFKERNIYRKILAAIAHPEVTEDFVVSNDDIYLLNEFDANNLPYFHKNSLEDTMAKNIGDYRKSVNHTRKYLLKNEKPTLDFDTHFPIIYNKKKFIDTFVCNDVNWDQPFGYVIKSFYTNSLEIKGEFGGDCKIHHSMSYNELKNKIGTKSFFSTSDRSLNDDMIKLLNELYPDKSKFEK